MNSTQFGCAEPVREPQRLVERAAREGVSLNTLVVSLIAEGLGKGSK